MSIYDVNPVSTEDYRIRAQRRLPNFLYQYIAGGANDEMTLAKNVSDFDQILLKQRVLRDVDNVATNTTLLGQSASMPVALAPVGMAGMFARRGETQAARAAFNCNIPFTASTVGICSVAEINAATPQPCWFQLYMLRDRDIILALLERAQQAGSTTLVFTVDLPTPGMRRADFRNGMLGGGLKAKLSMLGQLASRPAWAWDVGINGKPHVFGNLSAVVPNAHNLEAYAQFIGEQFDRTVTWEDIAWLRSVWKGKILIKGIMECDDALRAVDCGADGIVVSNHGGRQLDGIASSVAKLPAVVQTVGGRTEIFLDGGIRSGIDVVKALALGANGVLLGRAWVYAMAALGQQGVEDLLTTFQKEISTAMTLMGVNRLDEINGSLIDQATSPLDKPTR